MSSIVSRTLSVHQEHELLGRLEAAGLTPELAQRVIESKGNALAGEVVALLEDNSGTYTVSVDYSQPVSKLAKAGKFDYLNDLINDENFPAETTCSCCGHEVHRGVEGVNVHIVHFNRTMTSDEVIEDLGALGLRPANVRELLSFGAQHPDVQRQFPVVALGSVYADRSGDRYAPCLNGFSGRRNVYLFWADHGWDSYFRFAAVSLPAGQAGK